MMWEFLRAIKNYDQATISKILFATPKLLHQKLVAPYPEEFKEIIQDYIDHYKLDHNTLILGIVAEYLLSKASIDDPNFLMEKLLALIARVNKFHIPYYRNDPHDSLLIATIRRYPTKMRKVRYLGMYATSHETRAESIPFLLEQKADTHAYDAKGEHAMFIAASCANFSAMVALTKHDKNLINFPLASGKTPLEEAVARNEFLTAAMLIEFGASVDVNALWKVCNIAHRPKLKYLVALTKIAKQIKDYDAYYNEKLTKAVAINAIDHISYILKLRPKILHINEELAEKLILICVDQFQKQRHPQHINILKLLIKKSNLSSDFLQNLFMRVVKEDLLEAIDHLLQLFPLSLASKLEEALKHALDNHLNCARTIYQALIKVYKHKNPNTLELFPCPIELETLVEDGEYCPLVKKKGVPLLLENSFQGKRIMYAYNINTIQKTILLFAEAKAEESLVIYHTIYRHSKHHNAYLCKRDITNPKTIQIFVLDTSFLECSGGVAELEEIKAFLKDYPAYQFHYYVNKEVFLSTIGACGALTILAIYQLQNSNPMTAKLTPLFSQSLVVAAASSDDMKADTNADENGNKFYFLPPDFMVNMGSYDQLIEYVKNLLNRVNHLGCKHPFFKKTLSDIENMFEIAFTHREMKEITTPIKIENRNYKNESFPFSIKSITDIMPKNDAPATGSESLAVEFKNLETFFAYHDNNPIDTFINYMQHAFEYVYKNRSGYYLAAVHVATVEDYFSKLSADKVNQIIRRYNPDNYMVSADGKIILDEKRIQNEKSRQDFIKNAALMSWIRSSSQRLKLYKETVKEHKSVDLEQFIISHFGKAGLQEAYSPLPVNYFKKTAACTLPKAFSEPYRFYTTASAASSQQVAMDTSTEHDEESKESKSKDTSSISHTKIIKLLATAGSSSPKSAASPVEDDQEVASPEEDDQETASPMEVEQERALEAPIDLSTLSSASLATPSASGSLALFRDFAAVHYAKPFKF